MQTSRGRSCMLSLQCNWVEHAINSHDCFSCENNVNTHGNPPQFEDRQTIYDNRSIMTRSPNHMSSWTVFCIQLFGYSTILQIIHVTQTACRRNHAKLYYMTNYTSYGQFHWWNLNLELCRGFSEGCCCLPKGSPIVLISNNPGRVRMSLHKSMFATEQLSMFAYDHWTTNIGNKMSQENITGRKNTPP